MSNVRFDAVHSSDLRRSIMTALIISRGTLGAAPHSQAGGCEPPGRRTPHIRVNAQLREIDAGLWEWLTSEEARARYPEEYEAREQDVTGHPFPGGESFRDLRRRVIPAFMRIVEEGGENVLVVAHLGVNRVLLSEFLGLPLEEIFSIKRSYAQMDLLVASELSDGRHRIEVMPTL